MYVNWIFESDQNVWRLFNQTFERNKIEMFRMRMKNDESRWYVYTNCFSSVWTYTTNLVSWAECFSHWVNMKKKVVMCLLKWTNNFWKINLSLYSPREFTLDLLMCCINFSDEVEILSRRICYCNCYFPYFSISIVLSNVILLCLSLSFMNFS